MQEIERNRRFARAASAATKAEAAEGGVGRISPSRIGWAWQTNEPTAVGSEKLHFELQPILEAGPFDCRRPCRISIAACSDNFNHGPAHSGYLVRCQGDMPSGREIAKS